MLIINRHLKALSILVTPAMYGRAAVCITGKNLVKKDYRKGYLKNGTADLNYKNSPEHVTTKWFPVEPEGRHLVVSGDAYNRAVWQFGLKDGSILTDIPSSKKYRLKASKLFGLTFPKTAIPKDAVRARLFFARKADEETMPLGERLQVEYGLVPTSYEAYENEIISIPECEKGQKLLYYKESWYLVKTETELTEDTDFDALLQQEDTRLLKNGGKRPECGCSVFLIEKLADGSVTQFADGQVQGIYEKEPQDFDAVKRNGIYGVRHRLNDPVPVCERTGDAAGLHFNYMLESEPAAPYANDFDRIYPWSGMRRCAVSFQDGCRRVIYEGEQGYRTDGSAGEVMVEIPKHYVRREIKDGQEEIAVSAVPAEGFSLDPSFLTEEGELEAVYVGAYFASELRRAEETVLGSRKDRQVSMYRTAEEFLRMARANPGFQELDLCAALTIQRLFVIESAMLDSKSVFEGNIYMPYMISDKMSTYYSLDNGECSNTIRLRDNSISRRFLAGNAVAVMNRWPDFYSEEFANVDRVVTGRELCGDGTVKISFSGKPVNLTAHETGLSGLPERTGGPDRIEYPTGAGTESLPEIGHDAFKYRGIENVWGGIWVVLDGCSVTDSRLTVEYPDGRSAEISYLLPVQNVELSSKQFGAPHEMCVKRMGFDPDNPLIALPEQIGDGAGTCTWYCDAWYSQAAPGTRYVITYGGAWDNMGYAGIFAFRASFTEEQKITFNGARLLNRRACLIKD